VDGTPIASWCCCTAGEPTPLSEVLDLPGLRLWSLEAPYAHPAGGEARQWYDLSTPDWDGLEESAARVSRWLQNLPERSGIPLERTVLAGFSQGGAMTLECGLGLPLAGLITWSGFWHPGLSPTEVRCPQVLVCHGDQDMVVPFAAAREVVRQLEQRHVRTRFQPFPGGHEIPMAAITASREFLEAVLAPID
jgi:phospholipase/carboxylesterase